MLRGAIMSERDYFDFTVWDVSNYESRTEEVSSLATLKAPLIPRIGDSLYVKDEWWVVLRVEHDFGEYANEHQKHIFSYVDTDVICAKISK